MRRLIVIKRGVGMGKSRKVMFNGREINKHNKETIKEAIKEMPKKEEKKNVSFNPDVESIINQKKEDKIKDRINEKKIGIESKKMKREQLLKEIYNNFSKHK